jgi:hypothetical protein
MDKSKSHVLLSAKDASISFSSHSLTLSLSHHNHVFPDQTQINPSIKQSTHMGKKPIIITAIENHESPENPKNKTPQETRRS